MRYLPDLFKRNRAWASGRTAEDPHFFERQLDSQEPPYLWIGCADSRVPANEIVGLEPGELFVHRNVANVVDEDDLNLQSVLQYAIDFLKVHHVIVCGHYGCGGVRAALGDPVGPPLDQWIEHIRRVSDSHREELAALPSEDERWRRLCEINVRAQVERVCQSKSVLGAWRRSQQLVVHGWIYDLKDGLLRDLEVTTDGSEEAYASTDRTHGHDGAQATTGIDSSGDEFSLSEALEILRRTPAVLRQWLVGLPTDWLDRNEGGDTFSPRDVVGHLIHGEKTDWIPRLVQIMDGRGDIPFEPFDRFAMRHTESPSRFADLIEEFSRLRAENLQEVSDAGLSIKDLERTGLHPDLGVVTVGQLLATWAAHDLAHLAQIARTMAKRYADAVGPWRTHLRVMDRR